MTDKELTDLDIKILKHYKQGKSLSGFEGVHSHLCELGYLDSDLEITNKALDYINTNQL